MPSKFVSLLKFTQQNGHVVELELIVGKKLLLITELLCNSVPTLENNSPG